MASEAFVEQQITTLTELADSFADKAESAASSLITAAFQNISLNPIGIEATDLDDGRDAVDDAVNLATSNLEAMLSDLTAVLGIVDSIEATFPELNFVEVQLDETAADGLEDAAAALTSAADRVLDVLTSFDNDSFLNGIQSEFEPLIDQIVDLASIDIDGEIADIRAQYAQDSAGAIGKLTAFCENYSSIEDIRTKLPILSADRCDAGDTAEWQRERDRAEKQRVVDVDAAQNAVAARGFSMPSGYMSAQRERAEVRAYDAATQASRDAAIQWTALRVDVNKFHAQYLASNVKDIGTAILDAALRRMTGEISAVGLKVELRRAAVSALQAALNGYSALVDAKVGILTGKAQVASSVTSAFGQAMSGWATFANATASIEQARANINIAQNRALLDAAVADVDTQIKVADLRVQPRVQTVDAAARLGAAHVGAVSDVISNIAALLRITSSEAIAQGGLEVEQQRAFATAAVQSHASRVAGHQSAVEALGNIARAALSAQNTLSSANHSTTEDI